MPFKADAVIDKMNFLQGYDLPAEKYFKVTLFADSILVILLAKPFRPDQL